MRNQIVKSMLKRSSRKPIGEFAPTWTATAGARYSADSKTDKDGLNLGGWWGPKEFYNGGYDPCTPGTPGYRLPQGHDLDYGPGGSAAAYHLYGTLSKNDHSEKWRQSHMALRLCKHRLIQTRWFTQHCRPVIRPVVSVIARCAVVVMPQDRMYVNVPMDSLTSRPSCHTNQNW